MKLITALLSPFGRKVRVVLAEKKIDFELIEAKPGETVALVGPSGAGKSTIFQVLMRFFDPQGGAVLLDGQDLRNLRRDEFRQAMALVPQDPVIFAASAMDNIRFGRPGATDATLESKPAWRAGCAPSAGQCPGRTV